MILFRLLSAQPQTDGEHWLIKGQWHMDDWYTDAYGQNPAPFYRNPQLGGREGPPLPWRPHSESFLQPDDALWPGLFTFKMFLQNRANSDGTVTELLLIKGHTPPNQVSTTMGPPLVPLQATVGSGGSAGVGTWVLAVVSRDVDGFYSPPSSLVKAVVTSPGSTITIPNITWGPGASTYVVYFGPNILHMWKVANGTITGASITVSPGAADGDGPVDQNLNRFKILITKIVHGGVWGAGLASWGTHRLTVTGSATTANEWAGRVISQYGSQNVGITDIDGNIRQMAQNFGITASDTSGNLTVSQTVPGDVLTYPGDAFVMRAQANIASSNTIGDTHFVNAIAPTGLDANAEVGNRVMIIFGTGSWQPPRTIIANTSTTLTIAGTWDVIPDATSIFLIVEPTPVISAVSHTFMSDGTLGPESLIATIPVDKLTGSSYLIQVATVDVEENYYPMRYQPFRELFVPQLASGVFGYYHIVPNIINTTLTSSITDVQTTMDVASAAGFPDTPFLVKFASGEAVRVTARSGTSITAMDRAFNGTTAAAQASGSAAVVTLADIDLVNGGNQVITLNGEHITVTPPISSDVDISAGSTFALYEEQDSTGSRPAPVYVGGSGGFVSDTADQISVAPDASTRTAIIFTFHGTYWAQDSNTTGNALT